VLGAFLSWLTSLLIERRQKKKYLKTLKAELQSNLTYLENNYKKIINDYYIRKDKHIFYLSNSSWNQYKYAIDADIFKIISESYMLIGDINTLIHASFSNPEIRTDGALSDKMQSTIESIDSSLKKLNA
jgi:hypothetical protein